MKELFDRIALFSDATIMETHIIEGPDVDDEPVFVKTKGYLDEFKRRDLLEGVEDGYLKTFFYAGYTGWHVALKREQERAASL